VGVRCGEAGGTQAGGGGYVEEADEHHTHVVLALALADGLVHQRAARLAQERLIGEGKGRRRRRRRKKKRRRRGRRGGGGKHVHGRRGECVSEGGK
jgi:hypothetical protein